MRSWNKVYLLVYDMNKHIVKYAPKRELQKPIPATEEWKKAYRLMKVRKRCDFIFIYINSYIHVCVGLLVQERSIVTN